MEHDSSNKAFEQAVSFVNFTRSHLFLTGKAGTGKTTFLRYIKNHCPKKMVVLAPTGVAAINAGGVTIHSFFQLPFGIFAPTSEHVWGVNENQALYNKHQLLHKLKLNSAKRSIMEELELLIIDEVSMVRADLLDAISEILKWVRRNPKPFGGVQMLFIGDLFQLPPVVRNEDMATINQFYESPFFFDAHALKETPPVFLELKKIYRQSNQQFIHLLNQIRNSQVSQEELWQLNSYYQPEFEPREDEGYITLTSHNAIADQINQKALSALPGKAYHFRAIVEGDFPEKAYPAEKELELKVGAQIMFIKNDKGEERRFYNGKIGVVAQIDINQEIKIQFKDEKELLTLEPELWQNLRYEYDNEKDQIEEQEVGSFRQLPIRLAWAITVHKSQGLTFDKAVIDAGASFAPGQVYVALSRLRSLDGLVLRSRIMASSIRTDPSVMEYYDMAQDDQQLGQQLQQLQRQYIYTLILEAFDWNRLDYQIEAYIKENEQKLFNAHQDLLDKMKEIYGQIQQQRTTSEKFNFQLSQLLESADNENFEKLHQRTKAACGWFTDALAKQVIEPLKEQFKKLKSIKKTAAIQKKLIGLILPLERKVAQINQVIQLTESMCKSEAVTDWLASVTGLHRINVAEATKKLKPESKPPVGSSKKLSLTLLKEGMSIEQIAESRNLVVSTIESHLISFLETKEVDISLFVTKKQHKYIEELIYSNPEAKAGEIRALSGDSVSFTQIRAVATDLGIRLPLKPADNTGDLIIANSVDPDSNPITP